MKLRITFILMASLMSLGCIYKTPVQQGNILAQKDIDEIKPGMSKQQVAIILGTPSIADPFDQDRWDYISTSKLKGKMQPVKKFTVFFEDGKLVRTEGNYFPQSGEMADKNDLE